MQHLEFISYSLIITAKTIQYFTKLPLGKFKERKARTPLRSKGLK